VVQYKRWDLFRIGILEHCGPFIEIIKTKSTDADNEPEARTSTVKPTDTVQLLHQTVKEFLTKDGAEDLRIIPGMAVIAITKASADYLVLSTRNLDSKSPQGHEGFSLVTSKDRQGQLYPIVGTLSERPLLQYCLWSLFRQALPENLKVHSSSVTNHIVHDPISELLFASFIGAKLSQSKRAMGENYRARFFAAASKTHNNVVVDLLLWLLDDPNSSGQQECPVELKQALQDAVACGDLANTTLLLRNSLFRGQLGTFKDCVAAAIKADNEPILQCLLRHGPPRLEDFAEKIRNQENNSLTAQEKFKINSGIEEMTPKWVQRLLRGVPPETHLERFETDLDASHLLTD
jgi:hypothetical protein